MVNLTGAEVWRKNNLQGVPASGAHEPDKDEIIPWTVWLEAMLGAGTAGLAYATLTALNGDLAHSANTAATVYNDGSASGFYIKVGASGTGSWTRIGDLPTSVVRLTYASGSANAIVASAPEVPQQPGNKLYLYTPVANNTGATTINGAAVKNALGSSLASNSFVTDLPVLMAWQTDHYQTLVSLPVDATGVLNDVLAARDAAAASAAALGNQVHQYDTRAQAIAATIPVGVQAIKVTRYATGHQLAYATYIPGSSSGPAAFQEAGGHWWELDLSGGKVDPRWFGARFAPLVAADDTAALQLALTAAVGSELVLPCGKAGISATLDGTAGNVRMVGAGKDGLCVLQVLGSSVVDPMLKFTDASSVAIEGIDFFGNSITVNIGAIQFLVTAGSDVVGGYLVQHNRFRNFKAHYWMRFLTNVASTSHTRQMRYGRVLNNDFLSFSGNDYDFSSIAQPSSMIGFQGSVDNSGSYVDDFIVENNFADGSGVKTFATCWAGSRNVGIYKNIMLNFGALGTDDRGCYAVLAYNNHGSALPAYSPQDISVCFNTINAARTCGFYGAQVVRPNVSWNTITDVVDTTTGSLPYASISLNQCDDAKANFNTLRGNYIGVYVIPGTTSLANEAVGNLIESTIASCKGVTSTVAASFVNKVKITNNTILLSGGASVGVSCFSVGSGFEYDQLDLVGNRISATGSGIICADSTGGGIRGNGVLLQDNNVGGALATIAIELSNAVAKTVVRDGTIDLANAGASCVGLQFQSAVNINIDGIAIRNRATGSAFAFASSSAKGTMRNVALIGIARTNLPGDASGHMGFQAPTGVPVAGAGAFVQNLATTSYTPSGGYTTDGWAADGAGTWTAKKAAA